MRKILNISLPEKTATTAKKTAKKAGFSSVSSYVRFLLDEHSELITVDELLAMSKRADKEYKSGRMKSYKSLSELIKK